MAVKLLTETDFKKARPEQGFGQAFQLDFNISPDEDLFGRLSKKLENGYIEVGLDHDFGFVEFDIAEAEDAKKVEPQEIAASGKRHDELVEKVFEDGVFEDKEPQRRRRFDWQQLARDLSSVNLGNANLLNLKSIKKPQIDLTGAMAATQSRLARMAEFAVNTWDAAVHKTSGMRHDLSGFASNIKDVAVKRVAEKKKDLQGDVDVQVARPFSKTVKRTQKQLQEKIRNVLALPKRLPGIPAFMRQPILLSGFLTLGIFSGLINRSETALNNNAHKRKP